MPTAQLLGSFEQRTDRDPWAFYEEVRRHEPVWDQAMAAWLVGTYESCAAVLRDERRFSSAIADYPQADSILGRRSLQVIGGSRHARMHKQLAALFSLRASEEYRLRTIVPAVREWIATCRPDVTGPVNLVSNLDLLALRIVSRLLGSTWSDHELREVRGMLGPILTWFAAYGADSQAATDAARAASAVRKRLRPGVERELPDSTSIVHALDRAGRDVFRGWGRRDLLDQSLTIMLAGAGTMSETFSALVVRLGDDRTQAQLRRLPGLRSRFVDECLRIDSPVHARLRVVRDDAVIGGRLLRRGQRVMTLNAAANRDHQRYPHPSSFDLARRGHAAHLGFNVGPRHCPGATLARLEATALVHAILDDWPPFRLDVQPEYVGLVSRSYRPVVVTQTIDKG